MQLLIVMWFSLLFLLSILFCFVACLAKKSTYKIVGELKKQTIRTTVFICLLLSAGCTPSTAPPKAQPILINNTVLKDAKQKIEKGDPAIRQAFDVLIKEAEAALQEDLVSVTDKQKLPPSGDKHDYASYSRYWWPDPDQPDGLPYLRRDGETNPASQDLTASDRPRIGALAKHTQTLGLAYYFTGEEKYANKVAAFIKVWFLNPDTKMNPNVNHAQCRPGHNTGSKSGILDGRLLIPALESSLLIADSSSLTEEERAKLKEWVAEYYTWLTTNKMALDEAASKNNHGSFYDVQALYFALFNNDRSAAREIANGFKDRIRLQISADGSMPEEMARTRPLFYSIYNLHAMFMVAHLAEKVEVNLWQADDAGLLRALDFLTPYVDGERSWPTPTVSEADRMELYVLLKMAAFNNPSSDYLTLAEQLPKERRKLSRVQLAFPLMR